MDELITVEYWPNTASWRILVAGVAVGYWPTEKEATLRARQVRRELRAAIYARDKAHLLIHGPECAECGELYRIAEEAGHG